VVGGLDLFLERRREADGGLLDAAALVTNVGVDTLRIGTRGGRQGVRLGEGKRLRPVRGCGVAWSHRISEFLPTAMANSGE
jgi:hypothetical protein